MNRLFRDRGGCVFAVRIAQNHRLCVLSSAVLNQSRTDRRTPVVIAIHHPLRPRVLFRRERRKLFSDEFFRARRRDDPVLLGFRRRRQRVVEPPQLCRCFRAAALFEEDTHALKKIGKEGIAFVASSLSSRFFTPCCCIHHRANLRVHSKAQARLMIHFHFPETVTKCEAKTSLNPGRISRENARETRVIMLSHRAMRITRCATLSSAKRAFFFSSERELFSMSARTGRRRDFVSSSASSFPQRARAKFACWSCFTEQHSQGDKEEDDGEEEISFFCKKCAAIKHPNAFHDVSHYRLLSVPERFSVDKKTSGTFDEKFTKNTPPG